MSEDGGSYVTDPNGVRVWAPAPKPKRRSRAKGSSPGWPGGPARPVLSEAERLERAAITRERIELRKRELAVQERLAGTYLAAPGDPTVEASKMIALDARTIAGREILKLDRATIGSTLRIAARTYDGHAGGKPKFYALLCVWFRHQSGSSLRTKGVSIEGPELRAVGAALLSLADEYDAALLAGAEPWAQPDSAWKPAPEPEPAPVPASEGDAGTDCDRCGGELPDGHLDGCPAAEESADARTSTPSKPPRKGARAYVVASCGSDAGVVAENLTRQGHVAVVEGDSVRIGPMVDGDTADALACLLTRSRIPSRVEWAAP